MLLIALPRISAPATIPQQIAENSGEFAIAIRRPMEFVEQRYSIDKFTAATPDRDVEERCCSPALRRAVCIQAAFQ